MTKKMGLLLLVLVLIISLTSCSASKPGQGKSIAMIADTGGLEDDSYNNSAYEGLIQAEEEFGVEIKVVESQTADDYELNLRIASEEGADLIFAIGHLLTESVNNIANNLVDQEYAIIDETIEKDNVVSVTFKEHEGSFLVGVIAGLTTKSNIIGFIGGIQTPQIEKYEYGFKAGVKSVNPNAEVLVNYIGAFDNPSLGNEAAVAQKQLGADIVFEAAGACGLGVIQAAGEQNFWVIGVDEDQSSEDPEHVLVSMIKRFDIAAYTLVKSMVDDTITDNKIELGLEKNGVGYSDKAGNLPIQAVNIAEKYKEAIINKEFEVPYDEDTYDVFAVYDVE
ncbi:MAG: BMP family lipoprotein [Eubacteriaceae bacterium]